MQHNGVMILSIRLGAGEGNLGSINLGRVATLAEFNDLVRLGVAFLLCGTLRAELPYQKVYETRQKNRRLGLGLMGLHEWLLQRGKRYDPSDAELQGWLKVYTKADHYARITSSNLGVSTPVATRAVAPTGTIGILAGTTTGIEPIYAVAYRRRYLKNGTDWHYQYVVDSTAEELIQRYGLNPLEIETALDLAQDPERRIAMQALVQDHVDQGISSTINLPAWGSGQNNEDRVREFATLIAQYAPRLRGLTLYPDGARGGQPLTPVPYWFAKDRQGEEIAETRSHDVCDITGKGGSCGV